MLANDAATAPQTTISAFTLRSIVGYLISVAIIPAAGMLETVADRLMHIAPGPTVPHTPLTAPELVFGIALLFLILFSAGVLVTALPCIALHVFVTRFRIHNPIFFVVAGSAIGLLVFSLLAMLPTRPSGMGAYAVRWYEVHLIVMGAVAGLAYWGVAGRFIERKNASL